MKTALPRDELEMVATLVSLVDEMAHLKHDVQKCEQAIVDHADESRMTGKLVSDTIHELQFSVSGMKLSMQDMQECLAKLNAMCDSITTIGRLIVRSSKVLSWFTGITLAVMGIIKYLV